MFDNHEELQNSFLSPKTRVLIPLLPSNTSEAHLVTPRLTLP